MRSNKRIIQGLMNAGVHLGHRIDKWNPAMSTSLLGVRNGIHVIDLEEHVKMIEWVIRIVEKIGMNRGNVLFIGTCENMKEIVTVAAKRCNEPYVKNRWVGGTLTNWKVVFKCIEKLKSFDRKEGKDRPPSELRKYKRLESCFGGMKEMHSLPDAIFVLEVNKERMAIKEAMKLNIPIIGIVDSNSNPLGVTYPIPGNDNSIDSIYLYCNIIAQAIIEGRKKETSEFVSKVIA